MSNLVSQWQHRLLEVMQALLPNCIDSDNSDREDKPELISSDGTNVPDSDNSDSFVCCTITIN